MKKLLFIPFAVLLLAAGCSKDEGGEDPNPGPGPEPAKPVSVWDGTSVTEPADMDPTAKTATIMLASDLAWLSQESNASPENTFEGWTFTLGINIDLAGKKWTPIAQWIGSNPVIFKGTFDGKGHSIMGLNVDDTGQDNSGFFGVTQGAAIRNLQLEGSVRGQTQVGGICANAQQTTHIQNCTFTGNVNGTKNIGGICGYLISSSQIENCTSSGKVEITKQSGVYPYVYIGGICGWIQRSSHVLNCHSSATIVYGGGEIYIGGVIGTGSKEKGDNEIRNCSFSGKLEKGFDVTGKAYLGGIIGKLNASTISGCKNTADITIEGNSQIFLGGITGLIGTSPASIIGCYNTGAITNKSTVDGLTGGIAGAIEEGNAIGACYNTGKVTPASIETSIEDANYEINHWQQGNVTMVECFYKANVPEVEGAKRFTANQWPQAKANSGWNIGNDPEAGKFWKDLGTPGTEDYPALWWE